MLVDVLCTIDKQLEQFRGYSKVQKKRFVVNDYYTYETFVGWLMNGIIMDSNED